MIWLYKMLASGVLSINLTSGSLQPLSLRFAARRSASSFLVPVGAGLSNWFTIHTTWSP